MPTKFIRLLALALVVPGPTAAFSALTAAQKSTICGVRPTCTIAKRYDAGRSASGAALSVLEVRLGIADKPADGPDSGCRSEDKPDGGREYWLLEDAAPPKQVLKLCNDGYGAAGVGDDMVTVTANRLVHTQVGGSAWRWESTLTFTLSPWRAIAERDCSFNVLSPKTGAITVIDYLTMRARSVAKDSASSQGEDVGCPDWPAGARRHFAAQPVPGVFGAYSIVAPNLGGDGGTAKIPSGTAIGDCVPAMTTAGRNGFMAFGNPAPPGQAAEIRVIAGSLNSLLIQVFDPEANAQSLRAGRSATDLPHLEIWTGRNTESVRTRLPLGDLTQTTVDLNGKVYPGHGRTEAAPAVERWPARDAAGRPVVVLRLDWAKDTQFLYGVAIAYSQAKAGKRARMVATTGFAENRPLYVPDIVMVTSADIEPPPGKCRLRDGAMLVRD
ncbi:MAG TPA: hypothetical protein VM755_03070 [Stellaceae bacterium]|nr:hypothetical protein [Stellaceae bacterium]